MSPRNFLMTNITLISVCELSVIIGYARQKIYRKAVQSCIVWAVLLFALLYEYRARVNIPGFITTCTVVTIIGHLLVGKYLGLYHSSRVYDRFLHLFGAFSFSLLSFAILDHMFQLLDGNLMRTFLMVTTLGVTLGVLFEIAEFIHDSVSSKTKSQHGLVDTDYDLIFNVIGAFIGGGVSLYAFGI